MSAIEWPQAALDPIRRARVLAAAIPGAAFAEGVVDAPYDQTWSFVTHFENVPRFDRQVTRVEERSRTREGDVEHVHLVVRARGAPVPIDVRVEDGFCLMQARARLYLVVMAAVAIDGGVRTRFLHMEAVPRPGGAGMHGLLQREVDHDLAGITRLAARGF